MKKQSFSSFVCKKLIILKGRKIISECLQIEFYIFSCIKGKLAGAIPMFTINWVSDFAFDDQRWQSIVVNEFMDTTLKLGNIQIRYLLHFNL